MGPREYTWSHLLNTTKQFSKVFWKPTNIHLYYLANILRCLFHFGHFNEYVAISLEFFFNLLI